MWLQARLLCLGLDGSGKTSLLKRAADDSAEHSSSEPTRGFSVRTVVLPPNIKAEVWDLGGGPSVRPFWGRYATYDTHGLIWVVDSADAARMAESRAALRALLGEQAMLRRLPLLVLASKADLPGAVDEVATALSLGLDDLQSAQLALGTRCVRSVSAADGRGLRDALEWMRRAVGSDDEQEVEVRRS